MQDPLVGRNMPKGQRKWKIERLAVEEFCTKIQQFKKIKIKLILVLK